MNKLKVHLHGDAHGKAMPIGSAYERICIYCQGDGLVLDLQHALFNCRSTCSSMQADGKSSEQPAAIREEEDDTQPSQELSQQANEELRDAKEPKQDDQPRESTIAETETKPADASGAGKPVPSKQIEGGHQTGQPAPSTVPEPDNQRQAEAQAKFLDRLRQYLDSKGMFSLSLASHLFSNIRSANVQGPLSASRLADGGRLAVCGSVPSGPFQAQRGPSKILFQTELCWLALPGGEERLRGIASLLPVGADVCSFVQYFYPPGGSKRLRSQPEVRRSATNS